MSDFFLGVIDIKGLKMFTILCKKIEKKMYKYEVIPILCCTISRKKSQKGLHRSMVEGLSEMVTFNQTPEGSRMNHIGKALPSREMVRQEPAKSV